MGDRPLKYLDWRASKSTAKPDFFASVQRETAFDFPPAVRLAVLGAPFPGRKLGNGL
jgi:hypothetical protein